ncbi:MAG: NAD-dependent epimerase/dehydratase family protein [Phycisphaerales bacterium]
MRILITGAAGNLGALLARYLLGSPHTLRLMYHRKPLPIDLANDARIESVRADLNDPATLDAVCANVDCIVHFAGVLFAPGPAKFLPRTNVQYVRNLVEAAGRAGVKRWVLISFPHVEGETTPERPANGRRDGVPDSVHARTRLQAEHVVFDGAERFGFEPVILRAGMIYSRGVLMIDAAAWLSRRGLLGVWRKPTWIHLLSLADFNRCVVSAIERPGVTGIYCLGDDRPTTLQRFLDELARVNGWRRPWRAPGVMFDAAAGCCEAWARLFGTVSPVTRDFIRIGRASYVCDVSRMKRELLTDLAYPTWERGLELLRYADGGRR